MHRKYSVGGNTLPPPLLPVSLPLSLSNLRTRLVSGEKEAAKVFARRLPRCERHDDCNEIPFQIENDRRVNDVQIQIDVLPCIFHATGILDSKRYNTCRSHSNLLSVTCYRVFEILANLRQRVVPSLEGVRFSIEREMDCTLRENIRYVFVI